MDNINSMEYGELIELQNKVSTRVNEFNPVRLKKKWKRCGKEGCPCGAGQSDGSGGNLHGPYVYAQFIDNERGKMRSVSLGRYYDDEALIDIVEKGLNFLVHYHVDEGELEKMTSDEKQKYNYCFYLDDEDFEEYHGLTRAEDKMSRYDKFYGTQATHDAYEAASRDLSEHKLAATHKWATVYGIGSVKGQMVLRRLLAGKYYLKT